MQSMEPIKLMVVKTSNRIICSINCYKAPFKWADEITNCNTNQIIWRCLCNHAEYDGNCVASQQDTLPSQSIFRSRRDRLIKFFPLNRKNFMKWLAAKRTRSGGPNYRLLMRIIFFAWFQAIFDSIEKTICQSFIKFFRNARSLFHIKWSKTPYYPRLPIRFSSIGSQLANK